MPEGLDMPTAVDRRPVRYELHHEGPNHYVIRRVEVLGVFKSREEARQYMIDTTEERAARDA